MSTGFVSAEKQNRGNRIKFFQFDKQRQNTARQGILFAARFFCAPHPCGGRPTMRIDKFLKVSRILKRRTVAGEACKAGKVSVNGKDVKPAYSLKVGDEVELKFANGSLKFRVLELKETVKKDEAASLYEII